MTISLEDKRPDYLTAKAYIKFLDGFADRFWGLESTPEELEEASIHLTLEHVIEMHEHLLVELKRRQ